jgi:hypothetical protein
MAERTSTSEPRSATDEPAVGGGDQHASEPTVEDRDQDAVDQPSDLPRRALPGVMKRTVREFKAG